jgi:hypothetical protein
VCPLRASRVSSPSALAAATRLSWATRGCSWYYVLSRRILPLGHALKSAQMAGFILFLFDLDLNMLQTFKIFRDLNSSQKILK